MDAKGCSRLKYIVSFSDNNNAKVTDSLVCTIVSILSIIAGFSWRINRIEAQAAKHIFDLECGSFQTLNKYLG